MVMIRAERFKAIYCSSVWYATTCDICSAYMYLQKEICLLRRQ
jgi:hypothetical protein